MLSFGIHIHEKKKEGEKKRKKLNEKQQLLLDPTLEKEEGFQFQTSHGMNGKTGVPEGRGEHTPLVGCSANPMILILTKVALPSKLRKKEENKLKKRDRRTHTLSHSRTCVYTY